MAVTLFVGLTAGCHSPSGPSSMIPDERVARDAISVMMKTWEERHPVGILEQTSPRIQVVDTRRSKEPDLVRYQILSSAVDNRVYCFLIRLTFEGGEDPRNVRFYVVGIDPLLIFREEDYTMLMHWEHPMDPHASDH